MQVRHFAHIATIATAALLSMGTAAQAQEIDRSETLQARNLAARQLANPWQDQQRTRAAVVAEVRNLQAAGQMKSVGERADAPVVSSVPAGHALTRAEVKSDLALWRAAHPLNSGERG